MAITQNAPTACSTQIWLPRNAADAAAYFELGIAYSTGSDGVDVDMIEAHKWFNLASLGGVREGSQMRAEIAADMDRDAIAEAQRQARAWIAALSAALSAAPAASTRAAA